VRDNVRDVDVSTQEALAGRLDEIAALADARDPVMRPEFVRKPVPKPGPEDLKPFLESLSPYAPSTARVYLPALWADVPT
jgi:hypothetical protein